MVDFTGEKVQPQKITDRKRSGDSHKMQTLKPEMIVTMRKTYLSISDSRDESRNPFANGLLSIFSLVIWKKNSRHFHTKLNFKIILNPIYMCIYYTWFVSICRQTETTCNVHVYMAILTSWF